MFFDRFERLPDWQHPLPVNTGECRTQFLLTMTCERCNKEFSGIVSWRVIDGNPFSELYSAEASILRQAAKHTTACRGE